MRHIDNNTYIWYDCYMDKQLHRINSFIELEKYKRLKIKLIMEGKTLTDWINEQVEKEIATTD